MIEDFIIKDDEEPPLVSDETTSQKTRGVPVTHIGRDSNSNSSSTTRNRRHTAEGTILTIEHDPFLQRKWLSRGQGYILDSIGGEGSFVYVIDSGVNEDHDVSNFFFLFFFFFWGLF